MKNKLNRLYALVLAIVLVVTNLAVGHPVLAFTNESLGSKIESKVYTLDGLNPVTTSGQIQIDMNAHTTTPSQITIHMTQTPDTSVNFNWTTTEEAEAVVLVEESAGGTPVLYTGNTEQGGKITKDKYFHKVTVDGLKADTQYTYTIGSGVYAESGTFKTAPDKGSTSKVKFAYIADTQIRGEGFNPSAVPTSDEAKAVGAMFNQLSEIEDLDFTYIAGDLTDSSNNESQWEALFSNEGAFPTAGADFFKNNVVAVTVGNHDNNSFNGHINVPNQAGESVYSFEYGPVKFIVLNLEADMPADRNKQEAFLREEVAKAKENNQWTIVGFHKSIYTGGSHIMDSDVVTARKLWAPVLSELDVDMVLQGHDHVYARGFVNKRGYNANPAVDEDGVILKATSTPLYMVGGHAGALKWYGKDEEYSNNISPSDPISPNYEFLDFNSTDLVGADGKVEPFQTYIIVEMDNQQVQVETYMFKYNVETDQIEDLHLADEFTFKKAGRGATLSIGEEQVLIGKQVTLPIAVDTVEELVNVEAVVNYDSNLLSFESIVGAEGVAVDTTSHIPGSIAFELTSESTITTTEDTVVAYLTFTVNKEIQEDQITQVTVQSATFGQAGNSVVTEMYTENGLIEILTNLLGDMNKDGAINGIDALKLMQHLEGTYPLGNMVNYADINKDGKIDHEDIQMLLEISVH